MENLLLYFIKANGLIILFYLMYVLFLRKETFFISNRWYFIIGLLLSLVLPLITFTKTIWVEPTPVAAFYQEQVPTSSTLTEIPIQENPVDWLLIVLCAYLIISFLFLLKIGMELISFFKKIQHQNKQKESKYTLVDSDAIENPFSFFNYIVINKNRFSEAEIEHIVTHERIHVIQKHSIDVVTGKLFCALFWINPIVWFYRKAMLQNLEFIADSATVQLIENKYEYQKTLLKVVTRQHDLSITNQFYQSLIKKRIVMLHTNQSHKRNAWKYAIVLPLLVGFMLLFQIETVAQVKEDAKVATYAVAQVSFSSILTKNSTDKELQELEKTFSNEKYKLKISKIKRNKEGEIIGIKLSFDSGKTYNRILERKSTEPIDDIKIFINSDKDDDTTCGFEEVKNTVGVNWNDAESLNTVEIKKSATDEMIYIINGKEYTKEEMKGKIAELDGAIEANEDEKSGKKVIVFKGKSSISDEPKTTNSLNEITTKKESNKTKSDAVYAVVAAEFSEDETFNNIDRIKSDKTVDAKKALILFNGKEINYEDIDKIDPKTIRSFGTTVASHAIKKYGEKGKNGVIFINTKSHDIENNPAVSEYLNSKNNSDKPKPKTIELKNGDVVVVIDGDKIKFPGQPMLYLNQLKLEWQGKILKDNIDFFKNYEFEKIKDLIIVEDEMSTKEKKRIKKIIIETK
ncbi:M56 family metallopeptidase [Flavobacterium sp.]|jgi:beta-lactamase regulating signal transducer with metallopeptidase domain|uniref:M56 family metallopeptidase n=1 Tax=Flavobacterium sp. TaxID=239 RepID=UPI0037C0B124